MRLLHLQSRSALLQTQARKSKSLYGINVLRTHSDPSTVVLASHSMATVRGFVALPLTRRQTLAQAMYGAVNVVRQATLQCTIHKLSKLIVFPVRSCQQKFDASLPAMIPRCGGFPDMARRRAADRLAINPSHAWCQTIAIAPPATYRACAMVKTPPLESSKLAMGGCKAIVCVDGNQCARNRKLAGDRSRAPRKPAKFENGPRALTRGRRKHDRELAEQNAAGSDFRMTTG